MTLVQESLMESFRAAFASVLTQCSAQDWHSESAEVPISDLSWCWVRFRGEQSLRGEIAIALPPELAALLVQALLMTPERPSTLGDDELEALSELLRQVTGDAVNRMRSELPTAQLAFISAGSPEWKAAFSQGMKLSCGAESGTLAMQLSAELLESLDPASVEHTTPIPSVPTAGKNMELLLDVQLGARLRFGTRRMTLREILQLNAGAVIELDRLVQDPVDLLVDKKVVARGEVVVVDGNYGLRVTEIATARQRVENLYA